MSATSVPDARGDATMHRDARQSAVNDGKRERKAVSVG